MILMTNVKILHINEKNKPKLNRNYFFSFQKDWNSGIFFDGTALLMSTETNEIHVSSNANS